MMPQRPTVHLPPMPRPADYNYDPQKIGALNRRAKDEYDRAIAVWERVAARFAETHELGDSPGE
jgi:hypothetical protein